MNTNGTSGYVQHRTSRDGPVPDVSCVAAFVATDDGQLGTEDRRGTNP